jgi:hypothetical protein
MLPSVWPEIILSLKQMTDNTSPFSLQSSWISSLCLQISCSNNFLKIIHHAYPRKLFKDYTELTVSESFSSTRTFSISDAKGENLFSSLKPFKISLA